MSRATTYMARKLVSKPMGCTEFQLHKNVLNMPTGASRDKLLDFTEHKLRRMIKTTLEGDRKRALLELLADYHSGKVAIAWQNGNNPVYINIVKEI